MFFGETAASLRAGGEELTDRTGQTLRAWADRLRTSGVAAVFEAAQARGMTKRVLGWRGGERDMTDLAHLAELLHETAHREGYGLPALLDWLREECTGSGRTAERTRRLDSDAAAVQIMTVWVSKGLQYPVVYLPFGFTRHVVEETELLVFHQDGERCLDLGGKRHRGHRANQKLWRAEEAGDDIRLTYVALTRAQSQVVAWWAPSWDEINGGISRLLRGRKQGEAIVPDTLDRPSSDDEVLIWLRRWQQAGGPVVEDSVIGEQVEPVPEELPGGLGAGTFSREVDLAWRRTSYSGLIRAADQQLGGVTSEHEESQLEDESVDSVPTPEAAPADALPSPMDGLPAGATFGSLVHAVLEEADPLAPDLHAELAGKIREQLRFWRVDVTADVLATAMLPMHSTPLGPLVPGLTLGDLGRADRLRELDFEIPLAGGDRTVATDVQLSQLAPLLRTHLPAGDPLLPYADRLEQPLLGGQSLRGYLSGSIDVVLRVPHGPSHRFVVVDYKTNRLGRSRAAGDLRGVRAGAAGRGDAALRLSAAGDALLGGAAPVPPLAAAGLRPRSTSRWGDLPLSARDVRTGDAPRGRSPGRGVQLADADGARPGAVRTARRERVMTTAVDEFDSTLALAATGLLRDFNRAGVILAADVHVASRLTTLLAESNESVALACALVARAVRAGSICLDLTEVRDEVGDDGAELAWPAAGRMARGPGGQSPARGPASTPPRGHSPVLRSLLARRGTGRAGPSSPGRPSCPGDRRRGSAAGRARPALPRYFVRRAAGGGARPRLVNGRRS